MRQQKQSEVAGSDEVGEAETGAGTGSSASSG